ncbi:MAG: redoxin domain-containing protein [Bradymonadaceae bacterium]|nr:redoxin domain-containing protein [Lujinxingiaceae bacterium]
MSKSKKTVLILLVFGLGSLIGCDKGDASEPAATAQQAELNEVPAAEPGAAVLGERASEEAVATRPVIGQTAPDFTLVDEAGKSHKLSDYKGKIVVLEWFNIPCPYVRRHYDAKTFDRTIAEAGVEELVWLAIDSTHNNTPENSVEWKGTKTDQREVAYPILQDPDGAVGRLYEAKTTPHMFVVDAEGVLRYMGGIDDDPRGKNETPENYVLGALRSLKAGEEVTTTTSKPYGCTVKYKDS